MATTTRVSAAHRDRIVARLYEHGIAFGELGRVFGVRMGLHTTDAAAIVEILQAQDRGVPLTQTELSHRIGLTAGATSSLLNRLEAAGHVRRERGELDRRVVTLHASQEVDDEIARFFDPLSARIGELLRGMDATSLDDLERFLTELVATMTAFAADPPVLRASASTSAGGRTAD